VLKKTDHNLPWATFHIPAHKCAQAFFSIAVVSEVGNEAANLFWSDRWIQGQRIAYLAPQVFATVPKRISKRALHEAKRVVLQPRIDNIHVWMFSCDGKYSAKPAYENLFQGGVVFRS
jgi:hypothetical protein